jgi:hypothetical protein
MTIAAVALGLLIMAGVVIGLAKGPALGDLWRPLGRLGGGARRWWILAFAISLPLLVGVAAGLSTAESHALALLLLAAVLLPLVLACSWAWARARSFS